MNTPTPTQKDSKPTNGSLPKPATVDGKPATAEAKASEAKLETSGTGASAPETTPDARDQAGERRSTSESAAPADKKARAGRKVYIVSGQVLEFGNAAEAEKFLNAPATGPQVDFQVIKGNLVSKKQRVSLR